jgi:hypothetical protein
MKIKDLPKAYQIRALEYQKRYRGKEDLEDYLITAFVWKDTLEKEKAWENIAKGIFVPLIY